MMPKEEPAKNGTCWIRSALLVAFATAILVAAMPDIALALTVSGPKAVFETGKYTVSWSSTDPTGTARVYRSGVAWATISGSPGKTVSVGTIVFPKRALYHLSARLDATPTPVFSPELDVRSYARPGLASFVGIASGSLVGRVTRVKARVDLATTYVSLFVNKKFVRKLSVRPGSVTDLGKVTSASSTTLIQLASGNPAGYRTVATEVKLFSYPSDWHTCIVISTGQRRLYWIVDDVLVKSYPVATGRPSMPTPHRVWRIGAKYRTDPGSVYGPRKMRLFKKVGSTYQYTAYNLHGTNNQDSIGHYASHGCIRMFNRDVLELFPQVPMYTLVLTRG
jgi:lipoprotein-anchoring transpeptidase ErfK/SrfK